MAGGRVFFVSFWILPIISAVVWLGMLLAMLIYWLAIGSPHYASMDANQHIAYISDVGAETLKPLFIAGSCVTTVFLDLSFVAERWLRHKGFLTPNSTRGEKILSVLAIIFALCGTAGLILLSIFDTLRHPHLHDGFLLLFLAGYIICAIFLCAEYQLLGKRNRETRVLRLSFWIKLIFIVVEVVLAIAFGSLTFRGNKNVGAVIEWVIALIFTFWVLSFLIDLLPAKKDNTTGKGGDGIPQLEMGGGAGSHVVEDHQYAGPDTYRTGQSGFPNGSTTGLVNGSSKPNGYNASGRFAEGTTDSFTRQGATNNFSRPGYSSRPGTGQASSVAQSEATPPISHEKHIVAARNLNANF